MLSLEAGTIPTIKDIAARVARVAALAPLIASDGISDSLKGIAHPEKVSLSRSARMVATTNPKTTNESRRLIRVGVTFSLGMISACVT